MVKFNIVIQARMGSTRLAGKSLMKLGNYSLIEWSIIYLKKIFPNEKIYVATSTSKEDDALASLVSDKGICVFRGSEQDVFSRFYDLSLQFKDDEYIVRATADNPLKHEPSISYLKKKLYEVKYDYIAFQDLSKLAVEFINVGLLKKFRDSIYFDKNDQEHVTWNIRNKLDIKKLLINHSDTGLNKSYDHFFTIDTIEEYKKISKLISDFKIYPGFEIDVDKVYSHLSNF